jgi:dienelactone hydrolase
MKRAGLLLLVCVPVAALAGDIPDVRLFSGDSKPTDRRLSTVRTLNDKDFNFRPPANLAAWKARRQAVREQILVATGLWPLPPKTPLEPVIHGRIDRDGYSVEKVYFASLPGHYVTGNLYRPRGADGKLRPGKLPAVLCPHGHWRNGRFSDIGEAGAKEQVRIKAEKTIEGGRFHLQARCAGLARLGCVVFHYDMVGYADSTTIPHSAFADADAELRLQNLMGLQTWNSIRALDFVCSLPEVDVKRIGVTGASGGGTQSFILCAIDDRPAAAFPAVMVSTQMQGGCVCENCSYLRIGTGNVEFAALFAPKPLAMSAANDWTIDIERKGLPELKKLYQLYDKEDLATAKCWPMFDHNYNQLAREMMYNWFNKHLNLGQTSPIEEKPFQPIPPAQLSVFDKDHPRPKDSASAAKLREYLTAVSTKQIDHERLTDKTEPLGFHEVIGPALRVMIASELPLPRQVDAKPQGPAKGEKVKWTGYLIGRRGRSEQVPALWLEPKGFNGTAVVWIDPAGKASLVEKGEIVKGAQVLLDRGVAILAIDAFGTGELSQEKPPAVNSRFAGYTFGYNRPLLSQRVHDVLTAVGFARRQDGVKRVHLLGRGKTGPWVMLARALCGTAVQRTAADMDRFRFDSVRTTTDEMMLPGALKYGGLPALAALAAPSELLVHNHSGTGSGKWLRAVYKAAGAEDKLMRSSNPMAEDKVIAWLMR